MSRDVPECERQVSKSRKFYAMKKQDLIKTREKSIKELETQIQELKLKIADSKIQLATGKLKDTASIRKLRKQVAVIKTVIGEKRMSSHPSSVIRHP